VRTSRVTDCKKQVNRLYYQEAIECTVSQYESQERSRVQASQENCSLPHGSTEPAELLRIDTIASTETIDRSIGLHSTESIGLPLQRIENTADTNTAKNQLLQ
jgi:hypothetical protein